MQKIPALAVLVLFCALVTAHAQWREGGAAVPDTEWSKSDGDFGAMLLVTDDPEGFFERWNQPPSQDYMPRMATVSSATRDDTVVAVVIFTGCSANPNGDRESEVDFKVLFPDGSVYADLEGGELWTGKPAPTPPTIQVSIANLGLKIENDDPFGIYRMEAVVRDKVTSRQLKLSQELEVVGQ